MMKHRLHKITAAALTAALAFSLIACAGNNTGSGAGSSTAGSTPAQEEPAAQEQPAEETPPDDASGYSDAESQGGMLLGGWEKPDSPVITKDLEALVAKASANLTGAEYTPFALLGRQIVSGTNYLLLCGTKPVVPDAMETYTFVKIYEDLNGNAQIAEVSDTGIKTNIEHLDGGWYKAESAEITDEVKALCDKAFEKHTGVDYEPVALLSTQLTSGMNYCILCNSTVVYPGAESTYAFVYLSEDREGNVEVSDIISIDPNGAATESAEAE